MLYIIRFLIIALLVFTPVVILSSCVGGDGSSNVSSDTHHRDGWRNLGHL